jgi:hypothetical protein
MENGPKRVILKHPTGSAKIPTETWETPRNVIHPQPYPCRSLAATFLSGKRNLLLANSDFNVSSR